MARDPWLDNAKMTLVTLVVIGHFWAVLPDTTFNDHFYDFLYLWHIPAFVFVTGYLSRSFEWTRTKLLGLPRHRGRALRDLRVALRAVPDPGR